MRFNKLNDWLTWQESLNPKEIDLGLDRVSRVLKQAGYSSTFNCPLITVAGTNGKGSVVTSIEAIAIAAGLTVCSYTSPHIFHYNERIKINGLPVGDGDLCEAFERIDQARKELTLTYFEFGTLAAIDIFFRQSADLVILEVGLGGRLDAVNVMDADISVITSVAIDHVDWLGDNRESIGHEKAGIFRHKKPVICGDAKPPESVTAWAAKNQCEFFLSGRDYKIIIESEGSDEPVNSWAFDSSFGVLDGLPPPQLTGEFQKNNAAMAILAFQLLQVRTLPGFQFELSAVLPVALPAIRLPGRFQCLQTHPRIVVDVAHNPQAAQALASQLKDSQAAGGQGKTWGIVAMLADKDVEGVLANVSSEIDCWCLAGLENVMRGLSVLDLFKNVPDGFFTQTSSMLDAENRQDLALNQCTMLSETVLLADNVAKACELVLSKTSADDRIVIFGSFYTVAEAMRQFSLQVDDQF